MFTSLNAQLARERVAEAHRAACEGRAAAAADATGQSPKARPTVGPDRSSRRRWRARPSTNVG